MPHGRIGIPGRTFTTQRLLQLIADRGEAVPANSSGYLQFVGYAQLVAIAAHVDAVVRLDHRPGHFIVGGRPLATVWPQGAAQQVALALGEAHATGPHRTLMQDPVFAIDQLVEIAIRALSPAVNDTFTALTCIYWLSAGLCRVTERVLAERTFVCVTAGSWPPARTALRKRTLPGRSASTDLRADWPISRTSPERAASPPHPVLRAQSFALSPSRSVDVILCGGPGR